MGADGVALRDATGALVWLEPMTALGPEAVRNDIDEVVIDDQGAMILVGFDGWPELPAMDGMPAQSELRRAWVARYSAP